MASPSGIFNTIEVNSDLFSTWMRRQAELTTLRHQPYPDLFLDQVLWPQLLSKKDAILAALKEKCATAERPSDLSVPLWSFSHVFQERKSPLEGEVGSAWHHLALERGDKSAQRLQQIYENGWHPTLMLLVDDEDSGMILEKVTLYNTIKKTDFCHQLAARFGNNFVVSLFTEEVQLEMDPSGQTFRRPTFSLRLHYFPWGLPAHHEQKRSAFVEKFALRERRKLMAGEKLVFQKGKATIYYGPPLDEGGFLWPAGARAAGSGCYCGECDSEAE